MSNGNKIGPKTTSAIPHTPPSTTQPAQSKDEEQVKSAVSPLSQEDKSQIKGMHALDGDFKRASLDMQGDVKGKIQDATKSKLDGAAGISKSEYEAIKNDFQTKPQSAETVKWMEKNHPHLHAAITSNLDYDGYVGTTIGSLNLTRSGDELKQDASRRSQQLDKLPPTSDFRAEDGMPKSASPGDPVPTATAGDKWKEYKTGTNTTYVKNDAIKDISNEEANKSREAQKDYCAKMSGVIGTDIPNPPSIKAAQNYFQTLANRGASPDHIKKEYGEYLKTFYRHPGGVNWNPKLDPKNIDSQFGQQPVAKDGKRLVDCEGYSALTESMLGGLKKDGKPMFDIMHAGGPGHVFTGVFPHGGDPRKGGFVVNNNEIQDVKWNSMADGDFKRAKTEDTKKEFILKMHWHQQFGNPGKELEYGSDYTNMKPPSAKVPEKG